MTTSLVQNGTFEYINGGPYGGSRLGPDKHAILKGRREEEEEKKKRRREKKKEPKEGAW
jgi:hypothetical protein